MAEAAFNRILTLLRKERGITQKEAAQELGVSQALLSHYEKGIRECGLDFVVHAADFYGVSCDYLLGRSPDRSGLTLSVDDIPDSDDKTDNRFKGSIAAVLNKKLIANSLNILFDYLQRSSNRELIGGVSNYIMLSVYRMFRKLFAANSKNQKTMFSVSDKKATRFTDAEMMLIETKIDDALDDMRDSPLFEITTEKLNDSYPLYASSLLNLIQLSEKSINDDTSK